MIGIHVPVGWGDWLAVSNALLGIFLVAVNVVLFRKMRIARPLRVMLILIGMYWAGIYTFVYLVKPGYIEPVYFGQVFVRPAFTVTLAIMLACGIYRWLSYDRS